jgi:hypothetical protein
VTFSRLSDEQLVRVTKLLTIVGDNPERLRNHAALAAHSVRRAAQAVARGKRDARVRLGLELGDLLIEAW